MKKTNAVNAKVISILGDHAYHDGTSIGKALRMTRSAVWKTIKKLQTNGVQIESTKGTGYRLLEPFMLLEENKLKYFLKQDEIEICLFESLPSTNDYLKAHIKNKKTVVCLAEQQTKGKGRLNRTWYSPYAKNIYLSCHYYLKKEFSDLAGLGLIVGLAVAKTLNQYGAESLFSVKWPNDILYESKKIAGILIEIQAESHGGSHAIIGVGVNVNMLKDDQPIHQAWDSLQNILGKYIDRNECCARLIQQLLRYLDEFERHGFDSFIQEWNSKDCLVGKQISLNHANEKLTGMMRGINEQGQLLLEQSSGTVRAFSSGDASEVRGSVRLS